MPLEITYHANAANKNMAGHPILSETRTISASSQQSGGTPSTADLIWLIATEACRYAYGANPTATAAAGDSGHYLQAGSERQLPAVSGYKIAVITPS